MEKDFKKGILLFSLFWLVSAATFSGFASKWAMLDDLPRDNLYKMVEGTAHKPFIYRQLVPQIANLIEKITPQTVISKIANAYTVGPFRYFEKANHLANDSMNYKFKWIIVYWIIFMTIFSSLYLLHKILLNFGLTSFAAVTAPCLFILSVPIMQTIGGHWYDYTEILFMCLTLLSLIQGKKIMALIFVALGAYNKESFLFFVLTLLPFLDDSKIKTNKFVFWGIMLIISALINVWLKIVYSSNPGSAAEFFPWRNLRLHSNPLFYFQFDDSYGLIAPRGFNILNITLIVILFKMAWDQFCSQLKTHCKLALAINLPLYLAFGYPNEIRTLCFLYIPLVFLIAYSVLSLSKKLQLRPKAIIT